mgnify:CR=1 FL=1
MNKTDEMKRIFTILAAVLLIAGLHSKALAQSDASTTTASANVVQNITVGAESQNIDLGDIVAGTGKFISVHDMEVHLKDDEGITGGEQRGYFSIETAAGTVIDISIAVPSALEDGSNTLAVNFDSGVNGSSNLYMNGKVTNQAPTGTVAIANYSSGTGNHFTYNSDTSTWDLNNDQLITMDTDGKVYFALGGQVTANENQPAGNYSGSITLTATINN